MPESTTAQAPSHSGRLSPDASYERLGGIVRQLHDALRSLGYDAQLRRIANEIPDARDRLAYVGQMTEAAANKVLNLVDGASPGCDEIAQRTERLGEKLLAPAAAGGATLLADCADYVAHVGSFAETQRAVLTDIMLAQDFQDLSGQVIGKIIDIITRTERQLLDLLVHSGPHEPPPEEEALEGPQIPEKAMQQDDVDDLLASLGF
ncbi:MAG TPA: protein phosphatase CheZ [Burkholderiaceae bacterium]|nr:protein phosphatase CheZ [Burkholderiaceae bacterium]HMX10485.1 protein phosphatase CheZ [Burkholderiaceae bacterium]HMY98362.1 protein phosphatase CheZ [Burkholderiaceae bacterium]HNB44563.1 protein phosphatase CheZ [Burkholderiaceae bacterium]HNG80341.1 protein phosphatase CheZ [Burkholderiaceae bacterium]